jgi:hypothetical protein
MISRVTKTVTIVAVTTPLLMATLSGCVWRSKETVERETGAPVVMAPPPASGPVVMSPGPAAPAPTGVAGQTDRVMYQEGRWQLFGDGRNTPYYWVWVPAGSNLTGTPVPPARPSGVPAPSVVTYPEGRWQLYGDGRNSQYYWVWIPSGVTPPAPPLPPAG